MRIILAVAALVVAAPVSAAEFGGFMYDVSHGQYASDGSFEKQSEPRVGIIKVGPVEIELEVTTMETIAESLGAPVQQQGEAGEHVVWSCLARNDQTLWFYSDGEMGGGKVNAIAIENGVTNPDWGCAPAPKGFDVVELGIPGISAHVTELEGIFVPTELDENGRVGWRGEAPGSDGVVIYQDYVYRIAADGLVDAVGVSQISEN
jgi:hypothetical protein